MGRPPEGAEARSERITFRITPKGRAALRAVLREGEDEADAVREGLALLVAKRQRKSVRYDDRPGPR